MCVFWWKVIENDGKFNGFFFLHYFIIIIYVFLLLFKYFSGGFLNSV